MKQLCNQLCAPLLSSEIFTYRVLWKAIELTDKEMKDPTNNLFSYTLTCLHKSVKVYPPTELDSILVRLYLRLVPLTSLPTHSLQREMLNVI